MKMNSMWIDHYTHSENYRVTITYWVPTPYQQVMGKSVLKHKNSIHGSWHIAKFMFLYNQDLLPSFFLDLFLTNTVLKYIIIIPDLQQITGPIHAEKY